MASTEQSAHWLSSCKEQCGLHCHCQICRFKLANDFYSSVQQHRFRSHALIVTRHGFATVLSLAGLAALVGLAPLPLIGDAIAQSATTALVEKPLSLPDMVLGPAKASVTIVEYASLTCPHCAAFEQNVFPMLRSKYIDTGKVRFVFRAFPLDIKAAAGSVLARCIASDDAEKYFGVIDMLFKLQGPLLAQTVETLKLIGRQAGMDPQAVEACVKEQASLDKLAADQNFALEVLKVVSTPTFFINGEMLKGEMSFEELDKIIRSRLRR
jgi:protein-disulfide isomerase